MHMLVACGVQDSDNLLVAQFAHGNDLGPVGLRTHGVDTNGAAAEVMSFDRLGNKVHPGIFGE